MIQLLFRGGYTMIPIILCSVISVAVIIERWFSLREKKIVPRRLAEWLDKINPEASKLPEEEKGRYFKEQVVKFWSEQPVAAVKLYLEKLVYYFNFRNKYHTSSEASKTKEVILFVTYYPLLLCLGIRLFFTRKIPLSRIESLLVAIYIGSALFYAIFIPRIRFRLPFDVVLITHIGIMFSLVRESLSWGTTNSDKPERLER